VKGQIAEKTTVCQLGSTIFSSILLVLALSNYVHVSSRYAPKPKKKNIMTPLPLSKTKFTAGPFLSFIVTQK
jgi:hypothetical protein